MFTYDTRLVELGQGVYVHNCTKTQNNETKRPKRNHRNKRNHQNEQNSK